MAESAPRCRKPKPEPWGGVNAFRLRRSVPVAELSIQMFPRPLLRASASLRLRGRIRINNSNFPPARYTKSTPSTESTSSTILGIPGKVYLGAGGELVGAPASGPRLRILTSQRKA